MTLALEAEWKLLTDLIEERFGLSFTGVRRDILASRLAPRFRALQCANPSSTTITSSRTPSAIASWASSP